MNDIGRTTVWYDVGVMQEEEEGVDCLRFGSDVNNQPCKWSQAYFLMGVPQLEALKWA